MAILETVLIKMPLVKFLGIVWAQNTPQIQKHGAARLLCVSLYVWPIQLQFGEDEQ